MKFSSSTALLFFLFLVVSRAKCDHRNQTHANGTTEVETSASSAFNASNHSNETHSDDSEDESNAEEKDESLLDKLDHIWSEGENVKVRKPQDDITVEDSVRVLKRWHQLSGFLVDSLVHRSFSTVANLMLELDVSAACQTSMLRLVEGLRKQKSWAFKRKQFNWHGFHW